MGSVLLWLFRLRLRIVLVLPLVNVATFSGGAIQHCYQSNSATVTENMGYRLFNHKEFIFFNKIC